MDDASAFRLDDFDRDVEEKSIPEEDYPAAFARWIVQRTGGRADGRTDATLREGRGEQRVGRRV
jgi:hypothetical protein